MDAGAVFDLALQFTLAAEGGFSNDPADSGGPTQWGVTQHLYDTWRKKHGQPEQDVREITHDEATAVYRETFWLDAHLDKFLAAGCDQRLAVCLFDCGVNAGSSRAVKFLQAVLDIGTDGVLGNETIQETLRQQAENLVKPYNNRRRNYYRALANQNRAEQKFLNGWLNRVDNLDKFLNEHFA